MRSMKLGESLAILTFSLALTSDVSTAATLSFTDVDYPGAVWTYASGINDAGAVVGQYLDAAGTRHGFLFDGGTYTSIDCPSPYTAQTFAGDINNFGQIVGFCSAPGGVNGVYGTTRTFVMGAGTMTLLSDAGSYGGASTFGNSINDSGVIVGWYADVCLCRSHGFVWNTGTYTTLDVAGFPVTAAYGINNNGDVVGVVQPGGWGAGGNRGFLLRGGSYTLLDYPGAPATDATGIDDAGNVVGIHYSSPTGAYLYAGGVFHDIEHPDAQLTEAFGINSGGRIAGAYVDLAGNLHGFTAAPQQTYAADVRPPIDINGASVFSSSRGVVPVKFGLKLDGADTCQLPPATIGVFRLNGDSSQVINQEDYLMPPDEGAYFRVDDCQYIYNLRTKTVGAGSYEVRIQISGLDVGIARFTLK